MHGAYNVFASRVRVRVACAGPDAAFAEAGEDFRRDTVTSAASGRPAVPARGAACALLRGNGAQAAPAVRPGHSSISVKLSSC
jgi:hypothetical protein